MKRLGIIQPGKIGDIIICMPIAYYYFNKGYKVFWPIDKNIISNFVGYCDYIEFIPIDNHCDVARQVCIKQCSCNHIIDLSFTLPGSWDNFNTQYYKENELVTKFDKIKFDIADVPFDEKWNLQINRNIAKEQSLYKQLNPNNEEYVILQWRGSDYYKKIEIQDIKHIKQIKIQSITNSIFDWTLLLEKAKAFVLIDSSVANLVEQLKLPQPKIFLARQHARPTHKQHWKVIEYYD